MMITMQPTSEIVLVEGVPTRRWLGVTDHGIACDVFVRILRVGCDEDCSAFDRDLKTVPEPAGEPIDLRRLL